MTSCHSDNAAARDGNTAVIFSPTLRISVAPWFEPFRKPFPGGQARTRSGSGQPLAAQLRRAGEAAENQTEIRKARLLLRAKSGGEAEGLTRRPVAFTEDAQARCASPVAGTPGMRRHGRDTAVPSIDALSPAPSRLFSLSRWAHFEHRHSSISVAVGFPSAVTVLATREKFSPHLGQTPSGGRLLVIVSLAESAHATAFARAPLQCAHQSSNTGVSTSVPMTSCRATRHAPLSM
jgi:hypothetical protein